ncbi:hypothetical protein BLNAU_3955 [Blattamonas nauphoetae]|uniref:Uncharacterized protein n=1 Tax=Blattamonas nauphoetae TaxID=2049346 RepID=A0ABQ9YBQ2_9EUKA|nr:hypothetical protein BLNAU_3955 [Blattamonas nauphoetae]
MNLISVDLIPQIFIALNPLSLSFADAEDIHACLISIVNSAVLLGTPHLREILTNEHNHDQQRVHETVLQQLLVPSEAYLRNLCTNRHSIIDGRLSAEFMTLLADIILISPFCRPIMDFVVNMPVVLTITSSLTFFNNDGSIHIPLTVLSSSMEKWNEQCRDVRRTWPTIVRSLRMEGMDNVTEQRMHNNREGMIGQEVANNSIKLSNLQGMNTK